MVLSMEFYAASVAVPVLMTTVHANGATVWEALTHMYEHGAPGIHHMIVQQVGLTTEGFSTLEIGGKVLTFRPAFVLFEAVFLILLFGALFYLMGYNLFKMYGVDTTIAQVRGNWIGWFTTPGTSITEIND